MSSGQKRDGVTAIVDRVVERTHVCLRFVLGSREMASVRSLAVGEVLRFDAPVPPPVELVVEHLGKQVELGVGELVDIEGRRGVRVTRLHEVSDEPTR